MTGALFDDAFPEPAEKYRETQQAQTREDGDVSLEQPAWDKPKYQRAQAREDGDVALEGPRCVWQGRTKMLLLALRGVKDFAV